MKPFDLSRVCDPDCQRYDLSRPFVFREWRYASDGRIAVRVPAPGEADTPNDPAHPGKRPYPLIAVDVFGPVDFSRCDAALPVVDRWVACTWCYGTGRDQKECPTCSGAEVGCDTCFDRGEVAIDGSTCPKCLGKKRTTADRRIDGRLFAGWLLGIVYSVPGVRYERVPMAAAIGAAFRLQPLVFVGDGGLQGLLMPLDPNRGRAGG